MGVRLWDEHEQGLDPHERRSERKRFIPTIPDCLVGIPIITRVN